MRRDDRETAQAFYNFSFRYDREQFKGVPVSRFREALAAEIGRGVEASYQPLNACSLYAPHTKPWRYKLSERHWKRSIQGASCCPSVSGFTTSCPSASTSPP